MADPVQEMDAIAKDIDRVTNTLRDLTILTDVSHQASAMAFALAAANHVLHGNGSKADFDALVKAAWKRAASIHGV